MASPQLPKLRIPVTPSAPVPGASNAGTADMRWPSSSQIAGDRVQPVQLEPLAPHFDADAGRLTCEPIRPRLVPGGRSPVGTLSIPRGQPPDRARPGLVKMWGNRRTNPLHNFTPTTGFAVSAANLQLRSHMAAGGGSRIRTCMGLF